jgi:hypothetical protein
MVICYSLLVISFCKPDPPAQGFAECSASPQRTQRENNFHIGVDLPSLKLWQGREDANVKITAASQQNFIIIMVSNSEKSLN